MRSTEPASGPSKSRGRTLNIFLPPCSQLSSIAVVRCRPTIKLHLPAGLQWYSICRTTHNSETSFEFAARLAGRVQRGLGGIWPIDNLRLRYFPTENLGEFFCVNVSSRDNADHFATSCLTRYCRSHRSSTCSLSYYAVPFSK